MPHVIVKLWPGKSEEQKRQLAGKITKDVMEALNYGEESVSVSMEEINTKIERTRFTNRISSSSRTSYTRNLDTRCECELHGSLRKELSE